MKYCATIKKKKADLEPYQMTWSDFPEEMFEWVMQDAEKCVWNKWYQEKVLCVCMCLWACLCACMCVCMYMCACLCMCVIMEKIYALTLWNSHLRGLSHKACSFPSWPLLLYLKCQYSTLCHVLYTILFIDLFVGLFIYIYLSHWIRLGPCLFLSSFCSSAVSAPGTVPDPQ